tara:strand:- start:2341 stop:2643 length:303 start_codon:yes stop_codon:yes gene_type:complete
MKVVYLLFVIVLFSCSTQKELGPTGENGQNTGTIEIGNDCTFIHSDIDGDSITMYPVHLDKQFCISGKQIQFDYSISRAPQPTKCIVDLVVSISNVSLLK